MKDAGGTGAVAAGWPWGAGSSRAVTVTGPTGLRAQRALCTVQPQPGVLRQRVPVRWCCTVYNGTLCLCPVCILHDSSERSEVDLARAVWLPANQGREVLRRPAGFAAGGRCGSHFPIGAGPARRSVSSPFGSMDGRRSYRGPRSSHFWPRVCSAGPWLEGQQGKP